MSNLGFYSFNRITGLYCTSIDLFLALDLLGNLLLFNPDRRISAEDALDHIFLAEYSCPEDEPIALRSFHVENEVRIGQGRGPDIIVYFYPSISYQFCVACYTVI